MSKRGVVFALASILAVPVAARGQIASTAMLGPWQGDGHIVVNWTRQRTLAVKVVLFAGDSVSGTVGDATLVNGRFVRNRGALEGSLGWKTAYAIEGTLEGPVIKAENVWRPGVRIPLDWIEDRFDGGVNTSGWKVGTVEHRVLSATLVLRRPPAAISNMQPWMGTPPSLVTQSGVKP